MSLAEIIMLVLKASIVLMVFGIGLDATFTDATYLFRQPGKLLRSVLSMNVVMLVLAIVLVAVFNLHPAVKVALVALALSPVPPFLPKKGSKAGASESYMIGLLVAAALLAIVLVPLSLELLARIFNMPMGMPVSQVAKAVLITVLAPLLLGIAVRAVAPNFVAKVMKPLSLLATVMLLASALPVIIFSWPTIWSLIGNGTVLVLTAFAVVGLVTGHLLGGPPLEERTVLALCTASRHPGIAISIALANFSHQKLTTPAIMLYLIVSSIVTIPYMQWIKRQAGVNANKESDGLKQTPRSA